jgi:hypothetical protein
MGLEVRMVSLVFRLLEDLQIVFKFSNADNFLDNRILPYFWFLVRVCIHRTLILVVIQGIYIKLP